MNFILLSSLFLLAISGPAFLPDDSSPVLTQADIEFINQSQNLWTASLSWAGQMTVSQAKSLANAQIKPREFPEAPERLYMKLKAPTSFDSRTQWPGCVHPILQQGKCLASWAFGPTQALSDRLCVASKGQINIALSPQYLIDCDTFDFGCRGGYPDQAWNFLKTNGASTLTCLPYTDVDGACPSTCASGQILQLYKTSTVNTYSGVTAIQNAISTNGPVESTMTVYQDFVGYTGGIYKHTSGGVVGGASVRIIGWNNQNGTNYWICANNWGTSWGISGYFWIAFGECGIDNQAIGGIPKV
ncbi:unnamed protein product [Blepharisma stoltei]|uniref:Peptidase C1A papain C-terminal domain-containing protein n=1 Tax=Blepharisma stoltei TaxID=1481888 RepID=A0AAU9JQ36_9CILI|nr:unnamed protein product [Blepharisma stoltei]